MKAINIKTEYLDSPIGIDIANPRITWCCDSGIKQTFYRVECKCGDEILWDSGIVESGAMHCDMDLPCKSRLRVTVTVTLWDENKVAGESTETFFEFGLLEKDDWKAKWITGDYKATGKVRYPVDCFRKVFDAEKVVSARLYISACGLYEAYINGKKAGDTILAPGSTDNSVRIQYQTYDVTDLICTGENVITAELADGWYRGSSGSKGRVNTYGKETKLIAQLELTDAAGDVKTIATDGSWDWCCDGPILFADLKDGEKIDARNIPSYSGKAKETKCPVPLTASNNVAVKEHEHHKPIERIITPAGKTVLKFPQNLSGYISFKVMAKAGQKIFIRLGEMLDNAGEFSQKNIQCIHKGKPSPLQEITYVCKDGINEYKPKFFYGGFQYALVETDVEYSDDDFTQIAVYSSFDETSSFESSNELVNKFYNATKWSLKSNSTDFPSDCPTRERMGWTGDSQVFFNTASYMTNYASFARKHVRDIYDRQWKSGKLPQIVPYANEDWFMWTMNGSVGWACAGVYIPLRFYKKYGDKRILEEYYERMLSYARFMMKRQGKILAPYAKPLGISLKNRRYAVNVGQSYGEWAEPNDVCAFVWTDFAAPHPEESTAYTYFTLQRVLEIAEILGKPEDEVLKKIRRHSEGARTAYQEMVGKKKFTLDTDRQAKLVRPLYMGLLDEKQTEFAKERLIKALDNYGWRLGTGFLSTPFILYVLSELDIEYAYRLLENEEIPGWLSMPKAGAQTIWEAWEGNNTTDAGIASLNHYSKGAVCEWLFDTACGIRVEGENHFVITPKPGGKFEYMRAEYNSIYGRVSCGWKKTDGEYKYEIVIPPNCTADILLPGGISQTAESGHYII